MQYAVIQTGGKQYKVSAGAVLEVERLASENGSITFDKVLLYAVDEDVKVGTPYVNGVTVVAKLVEDIKGPKIHVSKFLAKSRYRRAMGHRQSLSKIQIEDILSGGKSVKPEVKASATEEKSVKSAPKKVASVKRTTKKA